MNYTLKLSLKGYVLWKIDQRLFLYYTFNTFLTAEAIFQTFKRVYPTLGTCIYTSLATT